MTRQLPTYKIHDTAFIVDVNKNELRQVGKERNRISFNSMVYNEDHYLIENYDLRNKNLQNIFQTNRGFITEVKIPQKVELDPVGMAAEHGLKVEGLAGKSDFEIIADQELFAERMGGKLPVIDIAGHPFIIDWRVNQLRAKDDFIAEPIKFYQMMNDGSNKLMFLYRPSKHEFVANDPGITELPKGVVLVTLPNELVLDPIAVARKYTNNIKDWCMRWPPKKHLKAKISPLEKTKLPCRVKANKKELLPKNKRKKTSSNKSKHL